MKRLRLQQTHRWWSPRSFDRHQHALRYHAPQECTRCDRQAQGQTGWQIDQQGPHLAHVIAAVAKKPSMFSKELASLLLSSKRLVAPAANSRNVAPPILPARLTISQGRVIGMIMARKTTRVAAARASRSLHTSSRKDATPASTAAAEASLSDIANVLESKPVARGQKAASLDPESDEEVLVKAEEVQEALSRPPPVNSDYVPVPWKGRLGYACLCTYLRYANPPIFSSRTCRIASILENRHPLKDPSQPFHPTKNRPDRNQPADITRGQAYVEALGLANARDIVKMLRWNDRYNIKFLRLSSEMFPFASHEIYGYKLAPFVSEVLEETGRVAAELGHRLTMHPGQFTQLGSPRKEVIESSIRDLEFHSELLQLLKLPPQQNRDAVMILHMGGVFGDKAATLDRFRENYKGLSQDIKNRLVLENDDVSWSVHDLLPICEELNIPLVLDFHHHNIIFDSDKLREGTLDIMQLFDRIRTTWTRKNITQKMHYSEPEPQAITPRQRRKHNPRVFTLPPCDPTMDLMIEAKDKEQAVFELMRKYRLPGHERLGELIPHVREDENKPWKPPKKTKKSGDYIDLSQLTPPPPSIPPEEVNMGGPENRVYWPPGHEDWLRPKKRVISRKPTESAVADGAGNETAEAGPAKSPTKSKSTKSSKSPKSKGTTKSRKRKSPEPSITSSSDEKEFPIPSPNPLPKRTLAHKPPFLGRWRRPAASIFPRPPPPSSAALLRSASNQSSRPWRNYYNRDDKNYTSRIFRALSFPRTRRRLQAQLWTFRHETLSHFRHRAQARLYRAIVKRQERLRLLRRGASSSSLGRRAGGSSSSSGRSIFSLLRALNWKRRAGLFLPPPVRGSTSRAVNQTLKNAGSGIRRSTMSRLGYGSEGYSDDSGRENGSRRQKMLGYLKAANEIRQSYQSSFSQKLYAERGVDAPGAFPDYDMTSPGEEEMVLFPSYARRHVKNSRRDGPIQDQPLPGTEEDIDRPRSPPGDVEYWREEWERYEDSNAIVDVDVRGWLYTPQNGPMNRKQRLMVALARKLSDIPPPTVTTNNPVQRHVAKREEEDARREAQYLVNKGEQDADVVWRTNHAENADSDSDMPKRVTRAGTDTSLDKNDLTGLNANLMERLRPFMYNPSVDSPVTVFFYNDQQSQSRTTVTNESGHFNIRAALEFVPTHVRVLASSESLSTTEEVKIVEPAGVSLISDIDDTIKHSAIASGAKEVFWNTFIRDFNDLTIDGVKEWYNRLADMGVGIHYVSNAPWQLYPQLKTYFKLAGLPSGSFHLKQYSGMLQGIFEPTAERKRMSLEKIMRDFPERKFILVGDSGEADLEVYTELVQQNPGRILGVFIRDVTTTEKREFFDNSFGQKRAGYNATSGFKDTADSIEKRPPLPPRQPSSAKTINNGDLMTFEDEASSSDNGGNMSDKSAVKGPPAKPSKPPGLRTAVTMPTPEPIRRNPAPRLPSKPSSLSSTPNESANEAEKKPPPLPQRKPVQQSETYTDAVKNLAMDVYNNIPSTKDTLGSLSNLSLKNDTTTTTRQEAPNSTATSTKRGAPPPVPPARRSVNATSASDMERKNSNNTPPAPPPRLPSRQSTLSSIASSTSTKQTGAFTTTNSNNSVPNFGYYDSTSEAPPPSSSQQPMRNKREELWKRRWERAQRILSDQGVLLGSWRVGSDVQDVSVWIVENAMKNKLTKKKSAMAGRLVDDK